MCRVLFIVGPPGAPTNLDNSTKAFCACCRVEVVLILFLVNHLSFLSFPGRQPDIC